VVKLERIIENDEKYVIREVVEMLETGMRKFVTDQVKVIEGTKTIECYQEEKNYLEKNQLISEDFKTEVRPASERFTEAYIERSDKETEEFIGEEKAEFLQKPITYFKEHKNEFMYMESQWFELVGVDAVSFEVDDVFGTYNVMIGLKLQKKIAAPITSFFENQLGGEEAKFELMFDGNEGIWNVNFALNDLIGFDETMTIAEAYSLIYQFLFNLAEAVDKGGK
jgi:hypothetical protein